MGEESNETLIGSTRWCPKCGAPLEPDAPRPEAAPGTPKCEACGAPIVQLQTNYLPEPSAVSPVEPLPPRGGRNPLALVVVAVVAAGMLYSGLHMARGSGTNHMIGLGYGTPAPDFTLEDVNGKNVSLSEFRGKKSVVLVFYRGYW